LRDHPSILPSAQLAVGPVPISKQTGNWPLLTVTKNLFESKSFTETTNPPASAILRDADLNDVGDWGDEELDGIDEPPTNAVSPARNASLDVEDETDGWGAEDDLDIPEVSPVNQAAAAFVAPKHGLPLTEVWKQSPIAADHIAAGSFESAMDLLNHQIGAVNFTPLKPYFLAILQATRVFVEATPSCPPITSVIARSWDDSKTLPKGPFVLDSLIAQLQEAYPIMTAGKFSDAVVVFQKILHESIFVTIKSEQEESEVHFF
jgi:coatomer protein complex subunit alpha (xenin)